MAFVGFSRHSPSEAMSARPARPRGSHPHIAHQPPASAADTGTAPSILRLFDSRGETPPSELSSWDLAFLQALYQSDQNSRAQVVDIANRVARDVL